MRTSCRNGQVDGLGTGEGAGNYDTITIEKTDGSVIVGTLERRAGGPNGPVFAKGSFAAPVAISKDGSDVGSSDSEAPKVTKDKKGFAPNKALCCKLQ